MKRPSFTNWARLFPPANWLANYRLAWLSSDAIAGITLVSICDTGVTRLCRARRLVAAGRDLWLPAWRYRLRPPWFFTPACDRPHFRDFPYDCQHGGEMAGGDMQRYAEIASLAAFTVAALSLLAWLLRLSVLVKLISDSILVGFKAGAGLTIAMTQLPSLLA